jgi:predicted AAA+ superfamily ATPase
MEINAYHAYRQPDLPITFFRTSTGQEVDFILGDKALAIEIKGAPRVHDGDLRSLRALQEDGPVKKCVVVCLEREPRTVANGIEILPWRLFIQRLWAEDGLLT